MTIIIIFGGSLSALVPVPGLSSSLDDISSRGLIRVYVLIRVAIASQTVTIKRQANDRSVNESKDNLEVMLLCVRMQMGGKV
jgi:hypothetical protein